MNILGVTPDTRRGPAVSVVGDVIVSHTLSWVPRLSPSLLKTSGLKDAEEVW